MRNASPPIDTSISYIKLVGLIELVSAIQSQNGHRSHSWILRVLQVQRLITFTLDPPSTIVPGSSRPLTIAVIAGPFVSTTVGPSSGFEKKAGAGGLSTAVNPDLSPSVNRVTNCNSRPNGSVI